MIKGTVHFDIAKASKAAKAGAARGLYLWAEEVLARSTKHVPIAPDGGTLMHSGRVVPPVPGVLIQEVSYDCVYAHWIHEGVGFHFSRPGRGAKFLENAVNSSQGVGKKLVASEIAKAVEA